MIVDFLATIAFLGLLITTATLKMMGSNNTQEFKLYLLLSTLAFFTCKIYNAIKYYQEVRLQDANENNSYEQQPLPSVFSTHKLAVFQTARIASSKIMEFSRKPNIFRHFRTYLRASRKSKGEFSRTYSP